MNMNKIFMSFSAICIDLQESMISLADIREHPRIHSGRKFPVLGKLQRLRHEYEMV